MATSLKHDHIAFHLEALLAEFWLEVDDLLLRNILDIEFCHHTVGIVRVRTTKFWVPIINVLVRAKQKPSKSVQLVHWHRLPNKNVTQLFEVCFVRLSWTFSWNKDPNSRLSPSKTIGVLSVSQIGESQSLLGEKALPVSIGVITLRFLISKAGEVQVWLRFLIHFKL